MTAPAVHRTTPSFDRTSLQTDAQFVACTENKQYRRLFCIVNSLVSERLL
jgi:hypothetical protein